MAGKFMKSLTRALLGAAALSAALAPLQAEACTSFLIKATNGDPVYGRTMEFGFELDSSAIVIPRKLEIGATGPDGKPGSGMTWTGKYAAIGLNGFDLPVLIDGMNEKGLTGGMLYFPGYASYTPAASAKADRAMASWDFLTWALTNFATVEEVKAALDGITITDVKEAALGFTPPLHYTLHDASGASIVIEPVDGGTLKVYDNPFGVMTNAPEFSWHLTNLKNYVKLSSYNAPPLELDGQTIDSFGQGSGMLGIPGDATPPSRLIRVLAYTMSAVPVASGPESVRLAEHIVNNFDIPIGWVNAEKGSKDSPDYTQWSTVADMKNASYYFKTYTNPVLRGMAFADYDLDAKDMVTIKLVDDIDPPALQPAK